MTETTKTTVAAPSTSKERYVRSVKSRTEGDFIVRHVKKLPAKPGQRRVQAQVALVKDEANAQPFVATAWFEPGETMPPKNEARYFILRESMTLDTETGNTYDNLDVEFMG